MKYNLSLGAIFKNEAPYFKEWIEHYLARGVEHFYLINDDSSDDYLQALDPYIKLNLITLFDVKIKMLFLNRQYVIYNNFFNIIKNETKWLIVCDLDEYIWSPLTINFNEILSSFEKESIYVCCPPSILFGSNGYIKQPDKIVPSFTKRQEINQKAVDFINKYMQTKYICLTSEVSEFGIHLCNIKNYNKGKVISPDPRDLNNAWFRLNHYRLQSKEKWIKNMNKTDVNCFNPSNACWFSPSLDYEIKRNKLLTDNYRTIQLFEGADKEQNQIEDHGLAIQNESIINKVRLDI